MKIQQLWFRWNLIFKELPQLNVLCYFPSITENSVHWQIFSVSCYNFSQNNVPSSHFFEKQRQQEQNPLPSSQDTALLLVWSLIGVKYWTESDGNTTVKVNESELSNIFSYLPWVIVKNILMHYFRLQNTVRLDVLLLWYILLSILVIKSASKKLWMPSRQISHSI